MKYNKIVSLLALGTLFGPTLLSSQQAFAEESGTVASNSATTSSTQQSTETTNPGSTEDTGNSETPIPDPEPATPHNLLANGAHLLLIIPLVMQMALKFPSNIHQIMD